MREHSCMARNDLEPSSRTAIQAEKNSPTSAVNVGFVGYPQAGFQAAISMGSGSLPSSQARAILRLQRSHGNRYVQRALAIARNSGSGEIAREEPEAHRDLAPSAESADTRVSIPAGPNDERQDIVASGVVRRAPQSGAADDGGAPAGADSCGKPMSMDKVTAGSFQGSLAMDKYYPDLGAGYWEHAGSAGPFDSGSRVGANVQLFGTVPSPCRPEQYALKQTVTYTRAIFDGVHDPAEGVVQDDVAKSGRDSFSSPFRQLFLERGLNISMADPPSTGYSSQSNIEWDRDFTTSLAGPGGTASVSWSTSIRVVNGRVTKNTVS